MIQRLSAVILAVYTIFLLGYVLFHAPMDFATWQNLFSMTTMQVATMLALLALVWHAWIGMWTICTDYLNCVCLRVTIEALILVTLLGYFFWGLYILWSL